MDDVSTAVLRLFLEHLGERLDRPASIYLLGGSALSLLGNPRVTVDIDYALDPGHPDLQSFQSTAAELAREMHLDVEMVPLEEFMPLPAHAETRHRLIERHGQLDVYLFDPYSIALSKIARGFEADIEDVLFLLRTEAIAWPQLERLFHTVLPDASKFDIAPSDFRAYFDEVRRRMMSA
jgi:hypothetical protein